MATTPNPKLSGKLLLEVTDASGEIATIPLGDIEIDVTLAFQKPPQSGIRLNTGSESVARGTS